MVDLTSQLANLGANRGPGLLAAIIVMTVLSTAAVVLRLWSKRLLRTSLKSDDYVILLALLFFWGAATVGFVALRYGYGKHALAIGMANVVANVKIMLAFELICTACLFTVKVSILLFYRRTFPVPSFQLAVKIVMAFEIVIPIVLCIVYLLQCRPLDYMWNRSLEGSCFNVKLYLQSTVIINVVSDFVVLFMPLPIIWGLRMSVGRKIAVSAMFALGTLACAASCVRYTAIAELDEWDPTWTSVSGGAWTYSEGCLGIVTACLPMLRPLYVRLAGKNPNPSNPSKAVTPSSGLSGGSRTQKSGSSQSQWRKAKAVSLCGKGEKEDDGSFQRLPESELSPSDGVNKDPEQGLSLEVIRVEAAGKR